ncbi:MAG: GNAT family N-acetyltransferase [Dehalococcoidia bacterium]|nr:GNAT family N-acetyltransferase [Dehalococcoidia bacterium]
MSIDVVVARTPEERDAAFRVRIAAFVVEQRIPRAEELDALDATATHAVGYVDGKPVAAGRLVLDGMQAKIGRMAVLKEHRGRGYGTAILAALEREARARGLRRCRLSAQVHAAGFYERAGYTRLGDVYDEVGIPHVGMEKAL